MRKHLFYLSMVLVLTLFSACGGGKKGVSYSDLQRSCV